jgi:hypothetical protein
MAVDDIALPPDLARYMRSLESRISLLERSNPLKRASAHDGTVTRVQVGEFTNPTTDDEDFGMVVYNDAGLIVWAVGGDGPLFPAATIGGWQKAGEFVAVTSSSFATQYALTALGLGMPVLRIDFPITVDTATTGEMRVQVTHTGTETSNVVALPALTNGTGKVSLTLSSLTDVEDGWTGEATADALESLIVSIQTRRVTGAGNVNMYHPQSATLFSSETSTGAQPLSACLSLE